MPYPTEPTGFVQVVIFQMLTHLRDIAGSIRISLFQLFMCLFLFFTYAIPDQANDIFVALSSEEYFQFTGLIISLLLISYINWFLVRYIFSTLQHYKRLPEHYSEKFYRNVIQPIVTLFPFVAATLGFYFSVTTGPPYERMLLVLCAGVLWYLILMSLIKKGVTPSLKLIMKTQQPKIHGLLLYKIIVVVFVLLFLSLVLLPQQTGWTRLFGPIVTISLGFCFWAWLGTYVYLYSRLWFTPFIPIALTYMFFVAEPFNNNHSVRTLKYEVTKRPSVDHQLKTWLQKKYEQQKTDFSEQVNVFIVAAEGGGIRSAYWTSGVLAWIEEQSGYTFHEDIIALSGVSGGSVGIGFFTSGLNAALYTHSLPALRENLRKTASADFLSDLNAGLIFMDVVQKSIPLPVGYFDRARRLEDAFSISFCENFQEKMSMDDGLCAQYSANKHPFNPLLIFNTTHVETGRKAIVSNCRIAQTQKYFHDVIDVLEKSGQDVPLKCAVSMSARFPFVTPPALVDSIGGKSWGHVVDGGYFENSGLHSAWQTSLVLAEVIRNEKENADSSYARFLNRLKVQVLYIKNSYTSENENVPPLKIEELAPANAFVNAWGRKTVTDIKHFENNLASSCFYQIRLKRSDNDGIPLGWYLSGKACIKLNNQLDSLKFAPVAISLMETLKKSER